MLEFNLNSLIWFLLGYGSALAVIVLVGVPKIYGRCLNLEKRMGSHRMKIENWKATPQRLAMSERKK